MCMVVCFREHAYVAILATNSKRYFWAACTVMKDCRSQFAWQCAYNWKRASGCRASSGLESMPTTGPRGTGSANVGSPVLARCCGYE